MTRAGPIVRYGVLLAHALEVHGTTRAAAHSQVVMLVLMTALTCPGLWLRSAALRA